MIGRRFSAWPWNWANSPNVANDQKMSTWCKVGRKPEENGLSTLGHFSRNHFPQLPNGLISWFPSFGSIKTKGVWLCKIHVWEFRRSAQFLFSSSNKYKDSFTPTHKSVLRWWFLSTVLGWQCLFLQIAFVFSSAKWARFHGPQHAYSPSTRPHVPMTWGACLFDID